LDCVLSIPFIIDPLEKFHQLGKITLSVSDRWRPEKRGGRPTIRENTRQ
jgi:hypothetical protein